MITAKHLFWENAVMYDKISLGHLDASVLKIEELPENKRGAQRVFAGKRIVNVLQKPTGIMEWGAYVLGSYDAKKLEERQIDAFAHNLAIAFFKEITRGDDYTEKSRFDHAKKIVLASELWLKKTITADDLMGLTLQYLGSPDYPYEKYTWKEAEVFNPNEVKDIVIQYRLGNYYYSRASHEALGKSLLIESANNGYGPANYILGKLNEESIDQSLLGPDSQLKKVYQYYEKAAFLADKNGIEGLARVIESRMNVAEKKHIAAALRKLNPESDKNYQTQLSTLLYCKNFNFNHASQTQYGELKEMLNYCGSDEFRHIFLRRCLIEESWNFKKDLIKAEELYELMHCAKREKDSLKGNILKGHLGQKYDKHHEASAAYYLGKVYEEGLFTEKNLHEARMYYWRATRGHSPMPMYQLDYARFCIFGIGGSISGDEAYEVLCNVDHFSKDEPERVYLLGVCYQNGYGVQRSDLDAFNCFSYIVDVSKNAYLEVAKYYLKESFSKYNPSQGLELLRAGIDWGHLRIRVEYALFMFTHSTNIEANERSFLLKILKECAEAGDVDAMYMLGLQLKKKDSGTLIHKMSVIKWLEVAAKQGYADAMYELADYYRQNDFEEYIYTDDSFNSSRVCGAKEAFKWYSKAYESGHSKARYYLGLCYYCGLGIEKDRFRAGSFFEEASKSGCNKAETAFSYAFLKDSKTPAVTPEYIEWLKDRASFNDVDGMYEYAELQHDVEQKQRLHKKAANLGHADSMYKFAKMSENRQIQLEWFQKAAYQKHEASAIALGVSRLMGKGCFSHQDYLEAFEWFDLDSGFKKASFYLGMFHVYGKVVRKDSHLAKKYFEIAKLVSAEGKIACEWIESGCKFFDVNTKSYRFFVEICVAFGDVNARVQLAFFHFREYLKLRRLGLQKNQQLQKELFLDNILPAQHMGGNAADALITYYAMVLHVGTNEIVLRKNPLGMFFVAQLIKDDDTLPRVDGLSYVECLLESAQMGCEQAKRALGECEATTFEAKGFQLALKGAELNVLPAMHAWVGYLMEKAEGCHEKLREVKSWYERIYKIYKCPKAALFLGKYILEYGEDEKQFKQAFECLNHANAAEYSSARNALAYCYLKGIGVDASYEKAKNYTDTLTATMVHLYDLAVMAEKAWRSGDTQDVREFYYGYFESAFKGYQPAIDEVKRLCDDLGRCYRDGEKVMFMKQIAIEGQISYFREVANKFNVPSAMYCLAKIGMNDNFEKAFSLHTKALDMGYIGSAFELGVMKYKNEKYRDATKFFLKTVEGDSAQYKKAAKYLAQIFKQTNQVFYARLAFEFDALSKQTNDDYYNDSKELIKDFCRIGAFEEYRLDESLYIKLEEEMKTKELSQYVSLERQWLFSKSMSFFQMQILFEYDIKYLYAPRNGLIKMIIYSAGKEASKSSGFELSIGSFLNDPMAAKWELKQLREEDIDDVSWNKLADTLYEWSQQHAEELSQKIKRFFELLMETNDVKNEKAKQIIRKRVASLVEYIIGAADEKDSKYIIAKGVAQLLYQGGLACADRAIVYLDEAENFLAMNTHKEEVLVSLWVNTFKKHVIESAVLLQNDPENVECYLHYLLVFKEVLGIKTNLDLMHFETYARKPEWFGVLGDLFKCFTASDLIGFVATQSHFRTLNKTECTLALKSIDEALQKVYDDEDDEEWEKKEKEILIKKVNEERRFYEEKAMELLLKEKYITKVVGNRN